MNQNSYVICPVCQKHRFPIDEGQSNICPVCGWIHDVVSENDPEKVWGPNELSLSDHTKRYQYYQEKIPGYHWKRDKYPTVPQIESILCPVCNKYRFSPLTWDEVCQGERPSEAFCPRCGWHYDEEQQDNPDLSLKTNILSLKSYRELYAQKCSEDPNYDYFEEMTVSYIATPHRCPVCGKYEFRDTCCFDICPYCGWEDDGTDDDSPILGANDLRFSEFKMRYEKLVSSNPKYKWSKDGRP